MRGLFEIRSIQAAEAGDWLRMRSALWPDGSGDHAEEIERFFAGTLIEPVEVLVATGEGGEWLGFAELSLRLDLPDLLGTRTGYIEGLYVIPQWRGRGVGRALVRASQGWARRAGCAAFASDRAGRVVVFSRF